MTQDFTTVTELPGDHVTTEQLDRLAHRYYWAAQYCHGKDVVELGCGAGQGLGLLASVAASVRAGDITSELVQRARAHYRDRIEIREMDAQGLPFPNHSLDVVLLFEAIYYLPSAERFVKECRRVLRNGGRVLIVSANKDLYDFNPSPFSHASYGVVELERLFRSHGFVCEFFGVTPVDSVSMRQRLLRPVKMLAVKANVIPKTMHGKRLLKRLVFGKLVTMPPEIDARTAQYVPPTPLAAGKADCRHKVIYLAATLPQ